MPHKILHTSDVHLMSLGDKACRSIKALVDLGIKEKVDLVVVAGDLFDHNRVDDQLVSYVIEQFQRLPVEVVILPGNHDCLISDSVYNRAGLWQGVDSIRILRDPDGETLYLPHRGVSLWGKPIDSYASGIQPMADIPRPESNGSWHIAIAHGYYVGGAPPYLPSLPITDEEIISSGWDYVALGHWPVFRCVCEEPKAYYCDSPSWAFPRATVNIVDFTEEGGVQVNCCSLPDDGA